MSIPFFDTPQYKNLIKIDARIQERCTLKNVILLLKCMLSAAQLAETRYRNYGWDNEKMNYRWLEKFGRDPAPEEYTFEEARNLIKTHGDDLDSMLKELDGGKKV